MWVTRHWLRTRLSKMLYFDFCNRRFVKYWTYRLNCYHTFENKVEHIWQKLVSTLHCCNYHHKPLKIFSNLFRELRNWDGQKVLSAVIFFKHLTYMNLVFVEEVKANEFLIVNIITKTFKFGIHRMRPFSDTRSKSKLWQNFITKWSSSRTSQFSNEFVWTNEISGFL